MDHPKFETTINQLSIPSSPGSDIEKLQQNLVKQVDSRPELNFAVHAHMIFASPWAKDLDKPKEFSWTTTSEGKEMDARLIIRPVAAQKRPTTTSNLYLSALFQIWEQQGRDPSGKIVFSDRKLAEMANRKWGGGVTAKAIRQHIDVLASTTFTWQYSWKTETYIDDLASGMNILEEPRVMSRKDIKSKDVFGTVHSVFINRKIVANLLAGKTKPFPHKAYSEIRDESAQPLYLMLDTFMADKTYYERKSEALFFENLDHTAQRYKERKHRKAKLEDWIRVLDGVETSSGVIQLWIEETADGKDWKLCCRKVSKSQKSLPGIVVRNSREDAELIAQKVVEQLELMNKGQISKPSFKTIAHAARFYDREMMMGVAAEVKTDYRDNIKKSVAATYMYRLHAACVDRGLKWFTNTKFKGEKSANTPTAHAAA